MRYRLMASYLGASYQAAVGPSDRDVTLFAAPPPPEEHGFSPVPGGGIWRKQVRLDDLDGLWESRPIGSYHGEPCLVLDDLGDRLHVVYLGMDERRAGQLGYWQVDRGVFEVVIQRHEVTDLAEERHEFPVALLLSALPRALDAGAGNGAGAGSMAGSVRAPGRAPGSGTAGTGSAGSRCPAAARARARPTVGSRPGTASRPSGPASSPRPSRSRRRRACSPPPGSSSSRPGSRRCTSRSQSDQQSMQQPAVAGGQQQMTGGYQSQPGMAPAGRRPGRGWPQPRR